MDLRRHFRNGYYPQFLSGISILILMLTLLGSSRSSCNGKPEPLPTPSPSPSPSPTEPTPPQETPEGWVYGVTMDAIVPIDAIVDSLSALSRKPTTRIVFDEFVPAVDYSEAVRRIGEYSFVMGELLDSYYLRQYSLAQYEARAREYFNLLGHRVHIWEIGNEINGDWLGANAIKKAEAAFKVVEAGGGKTALTLYYNQDCEDANGPMMDWVKAKVPANMRQGLDWVTVSYYEDDCEGRIVPLSEWTAVFQELHTLFPNATLLMGEVGTEHATRKETVMRRYYGDMRLPEVPQFKGGFFWWYGKQDIVPRTKPLWDVLNQLWMP